MLKEVANIARGLSADGVEAAKSGHPGLPLGCAEIGAVLYGEVMKHNPEDVEWPNRDRFVLSAGHGSMFLYSYLHLSGYDLSLADLKDFRQLGSKTPGHPEYEDTPGVETTTGPLGQGFANAVGMALAEEVLAEKYNTDNIDIVDHYTYTLLGDGCMMEGITAEAASLAGHLGLGKLITIYDDNEISIAGSTDLTFTEDVAAKFKACDWQVIEDVDGHNIAELRTAIKEAQENSEQPSLIMAKTHIGYGAPNKQDSSSAHGAPLGEDEIAGMKEELGLPKQKFYVSEAVREFFAKRKEELKEEYQAWQKKFAKWSEANPELKADWDRALNLELPSDLKELIEDIEIETPTATRDSSGAALRTIAEEVPYLIGGSADLAPSNRSYLDKYDEIQKDNYAGRNLRFGVREQAMAAVCNGLSLYGGLRPYCATFLVFSDYMRSSMRMSALMEQPVVYILTHDSIFVGEDGPTHQPVEHVESLRLIPNLKVIRPADDEETKAAWWEAMKRTEGPTALVLTRQGVPHIEKETVAVDKGGYVVTEDDQEEVTLMASGSEVSLAVEVAELLRDKGKAVRVLSIPDKEEFLAQDQEYIEQSLGSKDALRVAMEAGVGSGWYQLLGTKSHLVSLESFGASGPGEEVGKSFGFEAEEIAEDVLKKL
ncbi:transketolase [Fuchsiella alkaliacetigena]|uniref:transketolase n=1 Tax=Fuchsiella alkaliacetigena TaxID=957042 RepID=UPI00200A274B|nr:transketolase [Fuchsiella alkaliacetigena]MCK8824088.1 transketolase [Fuchsiella alkaliacetigena]